MRSIKQLIISGTIWTLISYGASQVLRFGSSIVLTRLLYPELFGLTSLVGSFIGGLHLFTDIGIGTSVIRSKRANEPDFYNTAWTLQVIRSIGIWIFCLLIAYPVSTFYKDPQLAWLLPVMSFTVVIDGFSSTSLFTLNRQMEFKQISIFELGTQIVQIAVMVIWAFFNQSIWAFVVGGLVSAVVRLVWSHRLNPGAPNRFVWDKEALDEMVVFGRWIFVSTALNFFANQSDRLILAKLIPLDLLGVYGIAYALAEVPKSIIFSLGGKVLFPAYTKFSELPRPEFLEKIKRVRFPVIMASAIGLALLVSFGDILIAILYDKRYADAEWIFPMLALGAWPVLLTVTVDTALFVIGKPKYIAFGCFWSALSLFVGIVLGHHQFGDAGAIAAIPISNIPLYLGIGFGLWKEKLSCVSQDLKVTIVFIILLVLSLAARTLVGFPSPLLRSLENLG